MNTGPLILIYAEYQQPSSNSKGPVDIYRGAWRGVVPSTKKSTDPPPPPTKKNVVDKKHIWFRLIF